MDVPITKDLTAIEHEQSSKQVTYNVESTGVNCLQCGAFKTDKITYVNMFALGVILSLSSNFPFQRKKSEEEGWKF